MSEEETPNKRARVDAGKNDQSNAEEAKNGGERNLYKDIENTLKSLADDTPGVVRLRINEDVVLVHEYILTSRSSVFRAMLASCMVESRSKTIDISSSDVQVVRDLIFFLFTDTYGFTTFENTKQMLDLANMYDIPFLVDKCKRFFLDVLKPGNAIEVFLVADRFHLLDMRSEAMDFILENYSKVLLGKSYANTCTSQPAIICEIQLAYRDKMLAKAKEKKRIIISNIVSVDSWGSATDTLIGKAWEVMLKEGPERVMLVLRSHETSNVRFLCTVVNQDPNKNIMIVGAHIFGPENTVWRRSRKSQGVTNPDSGFFVNGQLLVDLEIIDMDCF